MSLQIPYMGHDGFIWWMGVVENRLDPLKLGRCQVRIAGAHVADKVLIPTEDLPWAHPMMPLTDSSMLRIKEGDFVIGFYLDGDSAQHPVVMGILPGIPDSLAPPTRGFSDPRTTDELSKAPRPPKSLTIPTVGEGVKVTEFSGAQRYPNFLNEPTTSRLARNESITETIVDDKTKNLTKNIPIAGGGTFNEPPTPYRALFPYNQVIETESGHVIEYDDSPGGERIHFYHRSGTFVEIHPTGTMVTKVSTDAYEVVLSDKYLYVSGDCNITANGNMNFKATQNMTLEAKNITLQALGGFIKEEALTNITLQAHTGQGLFQTDAGSLTLYAGGTATIQGASEQFHPGIGPPIPIRTTNDTATPLSIQEQLTTDSEQKLIALEGAEAPIDGGANPVNAASLEAPDAPPSVASLPVSASSKPSESISTPAPEKRTPPTTCPGVAVPPIDYDLQLSTRFKLKHLTRDAMYKHFIPDAGQGELTAGDLVCNLKALCTEILEPLANQYPGFRINSAFRVQSGTSQHSKGEAADLQWPGYTTAQLHQIALWMKDNLPFDQLIFEYGTSAWIHVSFKRSGNRSVAAGNKVCSFRSEGWPNAIRKGGTYAGGLILLADRSHQTTGGGGITFV